MDGASEEHMEVEDQEGMPQLQDESGEQEEGESEGEGGPDAQDEDTEEMTGGQEGDQEGGEREELGESSPLGNDAEGTEQMPSPDTLDTQEGEHGEEFVEEEEEAEGGPRRETEDESESAETNNNDDADGHSDSAGTRKRNASPGGLEGAPKRKQVRSTSSGGQKHDMYCWTCHKDGVQAFCKICPRSYHTKCMHVSDDASKANTQQTEAVSKSCICPECAIVMNAENVETRSETMRKLSMDQLITMLKYACQRMKSVPQCEAFLYPVDPSEAIDYFEYIVYPMDLQTLENNVKKRQYGSTEAFLADAQWLVHNSVVFNSATSPFTNTAKKILKVCKQEIQDIETCPECYVNALNKPDVWFVEACKRPHILVWAKLKGFPFWPAKAMRIKDDQVDVRFFGAHDRSWVSRKDCFLYSEENPVHQAKRNAALQTAIEEVQAHIQKLKQQHGTFVKFTPRTPIIVTRITDDLIKQMLPDFKSEEPVPKPPSTSAQPAKKSPMTIRISSLKTNPIIVTNSVAEETAMSASATTVSDKGEVAGKGNGTKPETDKADEDGKTQETSEEAEPSVKPSGILATALTGRLTRRSSKAESDSSLSGSQTKLPKDEPVSADEGSKEAREGTPPPPKSFLKSLGLVKASDAKQVVKKPVTPQLGKLLHPSEVFVKEEVTDDESGPQTSSKSTNEGQAMRFNLSKDISISPVGDDSSADETGGSAQSQQPRRFIQGHGARIVPSLIASGRGGGGMPRAVVSANGQMQRLPGQRPNMRQMRPGGVPVRPGMVRVNSPRGNIQTQAGFASNTMQLKQVQSIQGAITLPGGTITVTPLAPVIGVPITDGTLNGGQVVVKQNIASTANGLPLSVLTSDGGQSLLKSNNKPNPQRRNLMNQVPPAVGHLVQELQKNLVENVKTTMEHIIVEMLENKNSASGSTDSKGLKEENERLKKQLMEFKHNHDTSIRELKEAMITDKKRSLAELRKQLEQDKTKCIEEAKKKQWCAKCGREAQFYCCWNTSYCGYPCQEEHWPAHMNSCSQGSNSRD